MPRRAPERVVCPAMPMLELVNDKPDWMGALGVALTRPPGVQERRSGEDPWRRTRRPERPRRVSDDLAWLRQAIDEPDANGLQRPGRHRGRRGVGARRRRDDAARPPARAAGARRRRLPPARLTMSSSPLAEALAADVLERLVRYARIDTQSRRDRERRPSTPGQLELGRLLADELRAIGLDDVAQDDEGYVFATLPGDRRGRARDRPARPPRHEPGRARQRRRAARAPRLRRRRRSRSRAAARCSIRTRMPELARKRRPRHRHQQRRHAARRRRQGRHGRGDGRRRAPRGPSRAAARRRCGSASRPTRRSARARRCFDIERFGAELRVHARRLRARRAAGRDVHAARRPTSRSTASTSTRASPPASSSTPRGWPGAILAALPPDRLTPETTAGREGFIHVYEVEGTRGHGDDPRDRARLRRRPARPARRGAAPHRRAGRRDGAARAARRRRRARSTRTCAASSTRARRSSAAAEEAIRREGLEPLPHPDPRRHGRLRC